MQIRLISGCLEPITEFRRTVSSVAHPAEANAYGAIQGLEKVSAVRVSIANPGYNSQRRNPLLKPVFGQLGTVQSLEVRGESACPSVMQVYLLLRWLRLLSVTLLTANPENPRNAFSRQRRLRSLQYLTETDIYDQILQSRTQFTNPGISGLIFRDPLFNLSNTRNCGLHLLMPHPELHWPIV